MKQLMPCLALACLLISGCSNHGENSGIEGTGSTQGAATAFGSVFVNGIRFDTSNANVFVNRSPASETELEVGMPLTVEGRIDGSIGVADRVLFDRQLFGPVNTVDTRTRSITMLGQTVVLNDLTVFHGVSEAQLAAELRLSVAGAFNSAGQLVAEYVQTESDGGELLEVEGIVVARSTSELMIGTLSIDTSAAAVDERADPLQVGSFVEVVGSIATSPERFLASRVVVKNAASALRSGNVHSISGIITGFSGSSRLQVNGVEVDLGSASRKDATGISLADNRRIIVSGRIGDDAVLWAESYELEKTPTTRLASTIVALSTESITLLGRPTILRDNTQYIDDGEMQLRRFGPEDFNIGDFVEARGFESADGTLLISRLTRTVPSSSDTVLGSIQSWDSAAREMEVAGVSLCGNDDTRYFLADDKEVDADTFFNEVRLSDLLSAKGAFDGEQLEVSEIRPAF